MEKFFIKKNLRENLSKFFDTFLELLENFLRFQKFQRKFLCGNFRENS